MRTSESTSDMTPERPTAPNVGRIAVAPQRSAGAIRLPSVSVPTANGSAPAATAAAGPADDPDEPCASGSRRPSASRAPGAVPGGASASVRGCGLRAMETHGLMMVHLLLALLASPSHHGHPHLYA